MYLVYGIILHHAWRKHDKGRPDASSLTSFPSAKESDCSYGVTLGGHV